MPGAIGIRVRDGDGDGDGGGDGYGDGDGVPGAIPISMATDHQPT